MNNNSNIAFLRARVERNFEEYKERFKGIDGEIVFDVAGEIARYTEMYEKIVNEDSLTETTAEFLLNYENPLKLLVDETDSYYMITDDLAGAVYEIIENESAEGHITVSEAKKLRDKHNTNDTLDALYCELLEISEKYFNYKGAEFCGN